MGHWIFFSTGFEYKIMSNEIEFMKEFGGKKVFNLLPYGNEMYNFYGKNKFRYNEENKYHVEECICCLEEIKYIVNFPCYHVICYKCFKTLVDKKQHKCPICRKDFIKTSIENRVKETIGREVDLEESVMISEEEYIRMLGDEVLQDFLEKGLMWHESDIEYIKRRINEEDIVQLLEEYDKSMEGTEELRQDLYSKVMTEEECMINLGILLYHQLLYTSILRVEYGE